MKNIWKQRFFLAAAILTLTALLYGCSGKETAAQTRNDLTAEHVRGLYADMKRSDVEDLLGKSDSALAENESFEMYSLADGTTAVLRYAGDKLQAAYIRGKDNIEEALFSNYGKDSTSTINDGTENSDKDADKNNTENDSNSKNESNPKDESSANGESTTLNDESESQSESK